MSSWQPPLVQRLRRNLAAQDLICLAFHAYLCLRVCLAPDSLDAQRSRPQMLALLLLTGTTVLLVRGELLPAGGLRAALYRLGIIVPVVLSYVPLRHLLPALRVPLLDAPLLALD